MTQVLDSNTTLIMVEAVSSICLFTSFQLKEYIDDTEDFINIHLVCVLGLKTIDMSGVEYVRINLHKTNPVWCSFANQLGQNHDIIL